MSQSLERLSNCNEKCINRLEGKERNDKKEEI